MNNDWTGGQYSIFRGLFGIYLLVHFMDLLPWGVEMFSSQGVLPDANLSPLISVFPNLFYLVDSPFSITFILILACIASLFFMMGQYDRIAAFFLWLVFAWFLGRNPLILNPAMPYVGWMLVAHLFVPTKPFGAFSARGRIDPNGGWHLPANIYFAAWAILALSYSYSGYTKLLSPSWVNGNAISLVLENPLARDTFLREWLTTFPPIYFKWLTWSVLYIELLFLPLILIRKLRPILWMLMLIIQLGFLLFLNFADLTIGMLLFHLLTFNPGWLRIKPSSSIETLYYDGNCGLCHSTIRFLLAEDKLVNFNFSPLQGSKFLSIKDKLPLESIPDSIVLITNSGKALTHSSAIIYLLHKLGGLWILLGCLLWLIPRAIRDIGYTCIGMIRHKLFKAPKDLCPIIDEELRSRFTF